jgi:uncharacterized membrane protein YhaH (DUF805 family)
MATPRFSFLYRTDEGEIDAATWWRGLLPLLGIFFVLTLGWILVEPVADKSLATTVSSTIVVVAGNIYRILYGAIGLLLLVCFYNLSAKRWRNLGKPPSFAGILPVVAAISGALNWLEPRVGGDLPQALVILADVILFGVFLWTFVECGGVRARFAAPRR